MRYVTFFSSFVRKCSNPKVKGTHGQSVNSEERLNVSSLSICLPCRHMRQRLTLHTLTISKPAFAFRSRRVSQPWKRHANCQDALCGNKNLPLGRDCYLLTISFYSVSSIAPWKIKVCEKTYFFWQVLSYLVAKMLSSLSLFFTPRLLRHWQNYKNMLIHYSRWAQKKGSLEAFF